MIGICSRGWDTRQVDWSVSDRSTFGGAITVYPAKTHVLPGMELGTSLPHNNLSR